MPGTSYLITIHTSILLLLGLGQAAIIISEVADKGSSNTCPNNEDWVELHNIGPSSVNLAGFKLHDDKGPDDNNAFIFPSDTALLSPNAFLVLCTRVDSGDNAASPQFKIGSDDTITLRDISGTIVSSSGALQDLGEYDLTWAYNSENVAYAYTSTPTPGSMNIFTESWPVVRTRLAKQHQDGEAFFESTDSLMPILPPVIELRLTMTAEDWTFQQKHVSFESYRPFTGLKVTSSSGSGSGIITHANLAVGGRARPRGQSTMAIPACLGVKTFPWLIDVAGGSDKTQRLFGMEKFYLRNHLSDHSYMRDWSMHRMLRRFDLPYLRARTTKLYVNGDYRGVYTLMEAPDQDYVFYRNFGMENTNIASTLPPFANGHCLYKFKTHSRNCGNWNSKTVANAQPPKYTPPADPSKYSFQRGEHRQLPVHVGDDGTRCVSEFYAMMEREEKDVISAWISSGKNCGKTMIENGLIDRDLGGSDPLTNNNDGRMMDFFNTYFANKAWNGCGGGGGDGDGDDDDDACGESNVVSNIDVDQWLKNFAVYAVTVGMDSPIGIGNNYYLGSPGGTLESERSYKMIQYDHNNVAEAAGMDLCASECKSRAIFWSITRPTCGAMRQNPHVGPLLSGKSNKANMKKYLSFVKDFNANVYTDSSFIAEVEAHAAAISSAVKTDPLIFAGGIFYSVEEKATSGQWKHFNLLAFMKARGEEVKKQLAALDAGIFPRKDSDVPMSENCQDWRAKETPSYVYEENDKTCTKEYVGCSFAYQCFDEKEKNCNAVTGEFVNTVLCGSDVAQHCRNCFPYSMCGSKGDHIRQKSTKSSAAMSPSPVLISSAGVVAMEKQDEDQESNATPSSTNYMSGTLSAEVAVLVIWVCILLNIRAAENILNG